MGRVAAIMATVLVIAGAAQSQAPAATRLADTSHLDDSVRAVAQTLRCPVCQSESIQESPSDLARDMRNVVRQQLAAGKSSDEVKAYFVSKYGDWILLKPRARGVGVAVYLLPMLWVVIGLVIVMLAVRRWTRAASVAAPHATDDPVSASASAEND
ncbi:MAG TPA: cytochrome c-type biogenesis protein [Gemmatimonadaceae bacterium]|nr:cytochrome c-type biogenesis protein [Gemmatimonadaceae bacterium]